MVQQYTQDRNSLTINGQALIVNYYEPKEERKEKLERDHQTIQNSESGDLNQIKQFS